MKLSDLFKKKTEKNGRDQGLDDYFDSISNGFAPKKKLRLNTETGELEVVNPNSSVNPLEGFVEIKPEEAKMYGH